MVIALGGIAKLPVAIFHIVNALVGFVEDAFLKSITVLGASGVQFFFIISGLVIPLSLIKSGYHWRKLGRFILKRTVRIEPTYLVFIDLTICFLLIRENILHDGALPFPMLKQLILNLTYLVPFFKGYRIDPVFWTLGVELQCSLSTLG